MILAFYNNAIFDKSFGLLTQIFEPASPYYDYRMTPPPGKISHTFTACDTVFSNLIAAIRIPFQN